MDLKWIYIQKGAKSLLFCSLIAVQLQYEIIPSTDVCCESHEILGAIW